ncbi:hypothetical protein K438DRAFT_1765949 [Mycena galopus ATCC 62051]|nr:hypothetical protein K438DRAFT_1765949 [Mycena galopus ATCC 62051]
MASKFPFQYGVHPNFWTSAFIPADGYQSLVSCRTSEDLRQQLEQHTCSCDRVLTITRCEEHTAKRTADTSSPRATTLKKRVPQSDTLLKLRTSPKKVDILGPLPNDTPLFPLLPSSRKLRHTIITDMCDNLSATAFEDVFVAS